MTPFWLIALVEILLVISLLLQRDVAFFKLRLLPLDFAFFILILSRMFATEKKENNKRN